MFSNGVYGLFDFKLNFGKEKKRSIFIKDEGIAGIWS